jgi:hypothetical protein
VERAASDIRVEIFSMTALHAFLPDPRIHEDDWVTTGASAADAFERARHYDLASSPAAAALFWLRTLPERIGARSEPAPKLDLHVDAIGRSGQGFMMLDDSPLQLVVGAVGRFWDHEITFARVSPTDFAKFSEPGWGKVAWALRSEPIPGGSRLTIEVSVTATDEASWAKLQRYFKVIGPFSRFIRRHELNLIARELGGERNLDAQRPLPGDSFIPTPKASATDVIVIDAPPIAVWPWLMQLGRGRGGWYSYDLLDNGGDPSATSIDLDLQTLATGDRLPTSADAHEGFTVLTLDPPRALVLGGLVDTETERSLPMSAQKPERFWQSSWAFVLDGMQGGRTRLWVRARVDYAPDTLPARLRLCALGLIHHFMESEQLKNLKLRAESRGVSAPSTRLSDVVEATYGAAMIVSNLATPFLRGERSHWGLTREEAERAYPGDELIDSPRWQWTHAVEIAASSRDVWPWVAQLGQDKAGFYSYQVLENLVGCQIHNADRIHSEWGHPGAGDELRLHPKAPPLVVHEAIEPQRLVVTAGLDPATGKAPARDCGHPYVAVTWAFLVEPIGDSRTRLISRYRCACSGDLATTLAYGPYIAESVGFAMDRRMLLGIQERAERQHERAIDR